MDNKKIIGYDISDIPQQDRECFFDMLTYVSEFIYGVNETKDDTAYLEVTEGKEAEVTSKLDILKKNLSETKYSCDVQEKVLFSSMDNRLINRESIYEELLRKKEIIELSSGSYAYGGMFLKVFNYFSERFMRFARELCGEDIKTYTVPVLYPVKEYERGKYFENFPHHIMFQTLIKNDIEVLNKFAESKMNNGELLKEMQIPCNVLRHATCAPVYQWRENTVEEYEKPATYLVTGRCFRNEDKNICELIRLNEFVMKEIVFIGRSGQVVDMLDKARGMWYSIIDDFKLCAEIKTANDSFFALNYQKQKLFQKLGESKIEFRLYVPARDTMVAVGSSNYHRTHFTMEYKIRTPEEYCHSACFASGIDRLTYAFLSQKGLDVSKWDDYSRNEIFKGGM
ncbi:MAG: hypothetical protein NC489_14580 [Ruminococcus flavefaciens]|nr:hypothetical protein [Ruminococcus flavefaciens]